jgi:hypothetical protein
MESRIREVFVSFPFTFSISEAAEGDLLLCSKEEHGMENLLFAGYARPRKSDLIFLKSLLPLVQNLQSIPPGQTRLAFASSDQIIFTLHLLQTQARREPLESKSADIAWRYLGLIAWGESRAAKVLSSSFGVPVRTIHTRLHMAREKGFLESPGYGSRLGSHPSI